MQRYSIIVILIIICSVSTFSQVWSEFPTISNSENSALHFFNDNEGIIVGWYKPFIQNTVDGGVNWNIFINPLYGDHNEIFFRDQYTGYIYGYEGLFRTTNSGVNWNSHPMSITLFGYCFINQNTGFIGGDGDYFITTNSGINWTRHYGFVTDTNYYGFSYVNNELFLLRDFGNYPSQFLRSTNLGVSWELRYTFQNGGWVHSTFAKNNTLYLLGRDENDTGQVYKSINGGANWTIFQPRGRSHLNDMMFHQQNSNFGYVVGNYDNDHNHGYKGIILRTTDAGDTWFESVYNNSGIMLKGVFITNRYVFVAGTGVVLRSDHTIGINIVSNSIPDNFILHQNNPNPFNPTTKIKFEVPQSFSNENLKLIVYDMLGSEIKVITDQKFAAGIYEVDFDAANLPSGIYFYKLSSGNLRDVKKMVLLK